MLHHGRRHRLPQKKSGNNVDTGANSTSCKKQDIEDQSAKGQNVTHHFF